MFDQLMAEKVQLGFDIATSVTIIGAFASWAWQSGRRARRDRQIGIREQTRAASLEKVGEILYEFENVFSKLIAAADKFERPITVRWDKLGGNGTVEALGEVMVDDANFFPQQTEYLQDLLLLVEEMYETVQVRRYSVYPVLDAIPEGEKFLQMFRQDMVEIAGVYNSLQGGPAHLLPKLQELKICVDNTRSEIIRQQEVDLNDEIALNKKVFDTLTDDSAFQKKILGVIVDKDNADFTFWFVPEEKEPLFAEAWDEDGKIVQGRNTDLFPDVWGELLWTMIRKPGRALSLGLVGANRQVMNARKECKDILIKLSVITNALLSNGADADLDVLVKRYESAAFFDREGSIR
ncbi:hypothetical protein Maes01_01865 [Microbulbifer aestuariivivens]|uniref:Uncharacterized protein n=1 Tax=Microbulbifer aestuariivivens TaxID=1908308 RepID=A0ABP9WQA0_9GAMM